VSGPAPPVREPVHEDAYVRFRDALLDFAEAPTPPNLVRYLLASRALDAEVPPLASRTAA
jgi:hypothetical protein